MKRIPIEMIIVLLLVGAAIGIAYWRSMAMEAQIANQNTRITSLEADRTKRLQLKACAGFVATIAAKCLHKASFGLVKFH